MEVTQFGVRLPHVLQEIVEIGPVRYVACA